MRKAIKQSSSNDVLDQILDRCIAIDGDARLQLACFGLASTGGHIEVASVEMRMDHVKPAQMGTRYRSFLALHSSKLI